MRTRRSLIGLTAAGVLALSACGGSDGDSSADTAASTAETTTTTVELATTTEAPATTTAPATTATTAAPAPAATDPLSGQIAPEPDVDGACLVGEWVVTEEEMNKFYDAIESTVDAPLALAVEGSAPLVFRADGTYRWDPEFTLTVEVAGTSGTGEATGDITGNWSASEGVLTTDSDVNALEVSITVGGVTIAGDDLANGLLDSSPINGVTYSCDGPAPMLDFLTGDPEVTVPITLTPA